MNLKTINNFKNFYKLIIYNTYIYKYKQKGNQIKK